MPQYDGDAGQGVTAYVIDTHVFPDHLFRGRAHSITPAESTSTMLNLRAAPRSVAAPPVSHPSYPSSLVQWGKTIPQNDQDIDSNGHGSHVAGTIGSRAYGVAKKADIVAVKVLGSNGSGTMSDVVGGVDWATKHAKAAADSARASNSTSYRGAVANMSLGGGKSVALDEAVNAAVDTGLHFAVAAGNDNRFVVLRAKKSIHG